MRGLVRQTLVLAKAASGQKARFGLATNTFAFRTLLTSSMSTTVEEGDVQVVIPKRDLEEGQEVDAKKIKNESGEDVDVPVDRKKRVRSQKYAMLLSYCGSGYYGLQRY